MLPACVFVFAFVGFDSHRDLVMSSSLPAGGAECASTISSPFAHVSPGKEEVALELCRRVQQALLTAVSERTKASLAISGGSMNNMLRALKDADDIPWEHVHVFWADERCVPHDHEDSNFGAACKAWIDAVNLDKANNVHPVPAPEKGADEAADAYETLLRSQPDAVLPKSADGTPAFDLLLLGFGPDGHTCSLFPGLPHMDDTSGRAVLAVHDSPKPPPERVTLTAGVCRASRSILFVGVGAEKASTVNICLSDDTASRQLPAARVTREAQQATWLLDMAAAAGELRNP